MVAGWVLCHLTLTTMKKKENTLDSIANHLVFDLTEDQIEELIEFTKFGLSVGASWHGGLFLLALQRGFFKDVHPRCVYEKYLSLFRTNKDVSQALVDPVAAYYPDNNFDVYRYYGWGSESRIGCCYMVDHWLRFNCRIEAGLEVIKAVLGDLDPWVLGYSEKGFDKIHFVIDQKVMLMIKKLVSC